MSDATTRTSDGVPGSGASSASKSEALARSMRRRGEESRFWWLVPTIYIIFLMLPIYWLINMSLKTNTEITSTFSLWPNDPRISWFVLKLMLASQ